MPSRLIAMLLLLLLPAVALTERPQLHDVTKRLVGEGPSVRWEFGHLSEGLDESPDDCELYLTNHEKTVGIAMAGYRTGLRSVTAVIGPMDPDTKSGRSAMRLGSDAIAVAAGIDASEVRSWILDNNMALRSSERTKPVRFGVDDLSGNGSIGNDGLTLYVTYSWGDAAEKRKPTKGLAKIEQAVRDAFNWSTEGQRAYQHSSGILVLFSTDHLGPRATMEYRPADKQQSTLATAYWLTFAGMAGNDDATYATNRDRIVRWFKAPVPSLQLIGAHLQIHDGADGKVVVTIRESK